MLFHFLRDFHAATLCLVDQFFQKKVIVARLAVVFVPVVRFNQLRPTDMAHRIVEIFDTV